MEIKRILKMKILNIEQLKPVFGDYKRIMERTILLKYLKI